MKKLTNIQERIMAESLVVLLNNNHIINIMQAPHIGGYQNARTNHSFYGYDIYVREEDYEQAKELLQLIQPEELEVNVTSEVDMEYSNEDQEYNSQLKKNNKRINRLYQIRRFWVRILLIGIFIFWVYSFIVNYLNK